MISIVIGPQCICTTRWHVLMLPYPILPALSYSPARTINWGLLRSELAALPRTLPFNAAT